MVMSLSRPTWEQRQGRISATYGAPPGGNGFSVPICAKTDFSFDGRNVVNAQQIYPLAVGIDVTAWVSGIVSVRVFSKTTWASSAILHVIVQNVQIEADQPDVVFINQTFVADVQLTEANTTTALNVPGLFTQALTAPIGPQFRVVLRWDQGTVTLSAQQNATIAVDLIGRPA